jgi:uncharacterized protein
MSVRLAAGLVGVAFGFMLSWSGLSDPDVIRRGLLFQEAYLFLLFFAAMGTATVGVQLLRRLRPRALVTRDPISVEALSPERRHVVGGAVFGVGWAIAAACPGPIAAQVGQGIAWGLVTMAGLVLGIMLHRVRERRGAPGLADLAPARAPTA